MPSDACSVVSLKNAAKTSTRCILRAAREESIIIMMLNMVWATTKHPLLWSSHVMLRLRALRTGRVADDLLWSNYGTRECTKSNKQLAVSALG